MPLIELKNIVRTYRSAGGVEVRALRGINLNIERGEFLSIMGPSGSGKSTLMNTLGCLDRPTSGSYILDGRETAHLTRDQRAWVRNRSLGFVFQGFNLLARTSALENVELPLLYRGERDAKKRRQLALEVLERVGLGKRSHHVPSQMSGGEQQRVAIARALVTRPPLILADEPTGDLDAAGAQAVVAQLRALARDGQHTIVMATHNQRLVDAGDQLIRLANGRQESR